MEVCESMGDLEREKYQFPAAGDMKHEETEALGGT
jgi:hypothetical protein